MNLHDASEPEETPNRAEIPVGADEVGHQSYATIVAQIREGDDSGMTALYALLSRGVRYYLMRQLGVQEVDDRRHDVFVAVAQAIQKGSLRDPACLLGYVRTVARFQAASAIAELIRKRTAFAALDPEEPIADSALGPHETAGNEQRMDLMRRVLNGLSQRDREVLRRFYLDKESKDEICAGLNLTETQFRLVKSRAKARFAELGSRILRKPVTPAPVLVRHAVA